MKGLVIGFLFVSCTWSQPPSEDILIMGLAQAPKTLDPRFTTGATGQRIAHLMFSSLVRLDSQLKVVGDAASQWTYKNKTYTFELQSGITFHDGSPLTAEDLIFSFEECRKSSSPFSAMMKVIKKVEARYDDKKRYLKIHLKKFSAVFLSDLVPIKILPKKLVLKLGPDFYKNPIGSGPLQFISQKNNDYNFARYPQYFSKNSVMPKVRIKIVKDDNTRFQKLYKGDLDIVQNDLPYNKIGVFQDLKGFKVSFDKSLKTTYLLLNLKDEHLSQKRVRSAIHQSINREEIIKFSLEGLAEPATSLISPNTSYFHDQLERGKLPIDEQHLELEKINKTFILKSSNNSRAIANARILVDQLKKNGLNVELQSRDWGVFYDDVKKGQFEMATMKLVGAIDPDTYRIFFHSKEVPPGRNRGFYSNSKLDKMLEKGFSEEDPAKRAATYQLVQEIVYEDLPIIPLWYEKQFAVVHSRIKNYTLPKNGDFSSLLTAHKDNHE